MTVQKQPDTVVSDDDLEPLPPLDGAAEDDPELPYDELLDDAPDGDPFDDATGEDAPVDASEVAGAESEGGWLEGSEEAGALDIGPVELTSFEPGSLTGNEAEEPGVGEEDFGLGDEAPGGLDAGEEGPEADDEELRDADLPRLDADEEGDVDDADLVDPGFAQGVEVDLPWAERRWEPVSHDEGGTFEHARALVAQADAAREDARDGFARAGLPFGARALYAARGASRACGAPGVGVSVCIGDAGWQAMPASSGVTALAFLDDQGMLLVALYAEGEETTRLVVAGASEPRVVAEIGPPALRTDEEEARVSTLVCDDAHGVVWVAGGFGLLAFELPR